MKNRLKKSTALPLALLVYITATAAYFLPRNTEISVAEKYITVAASYVIVFLLWLVLRRRERKEGESEDFPARRGG